MSKSFVMDDEHWITINGNHVLINEKGEVQSGMGGALKGVKLSKPKSNMKGKLSSAKKEYEQHDKKFGARYKSEFDRHNRALERINKEQERLDKEHENDWQEKDRDTYMKKRSELRNAEAELDGKKRDEDIKNESKLKQIGERSGYEKKGIYLKKEGVKKALSSARGKLKSAREANAYIKQRGTKISPLAKGGKGKFSNIDKEYDEADKRYNEKVNQGNEKVRQAFNERDEKVKKLNVEHNNFEDRNRKRRMALRSAERRLQKLDGGTGKYNRLVKRIENERDKNYSESDKQSNAYANKRLAAENAAWEVSNKTSEQRAKDFDTMLKEHKKARRKEKVAKEVLAKARPKIAERRKAVKAYNEREDEKIAKAMGLGKYRKPYYETDAFKSGKKSDYI